MPRFDGTGPASGGTGTGRGLGPCGCGLRRGLGRRFDFTSPIKLSKEQQKKVLEAELEQLKAETKQIEEALSQL